MAETNNDNVMLSQAEIDKLIKKMEEEKAEKK
jgi:flagellar motor switch protein FliM